jgi:hypothetical protein
MSRRQTSLLIANRPSREALRKYKPRPPDTAIVAEKAAREARRAEIHRELEAAVALAQERKARRALKRAQRDGNRFAEGVKVDVR